MTHVDLDGTPHTNNPLSSEFRPNTASYTHPQLLRQYPTPSGSRTSIKLDPASFNPLPDLTGINPSAAVWDSLSTFMMDINTKLNAAKGPTTTPSKTEHRPRGSSRRATPMRSVSPKLSSAHNVDALVLRAGRVGGGCSAEVRMPFYKRSRSHDPAYRRAQARTRAIRMWDSWTHRNKSSN